LDTPEENQESGTGPLGEGSPAEPGAAPGGAPAGGAPPGGGSAPQPPFLGPWPVEPPRPRGAGRAGTALVALVAAVVGSLVTLLLLPYVAPAYLNRAEPPQIPVAPAASPSSGQPVAESVFKEVAPAVVAIVNRSTTHNIFGMTQIQEGTGSGVVFDPRGYIVTNYHVVAGAQQLTVILPDGTHLPAKLVGRDPPSDLAVVKVNAGHPLKTAAFADSSKVVPGQWAIAIGNPLGLDLSQTVTVGVVSGVRTMLYGYGQEQRDTRLIQTDAAINPGNSGGPLCNAAGQVIGLNTWKVAQVQGEGIAAEGIGFAVPSNTVRAVADDLVRYGYVKRAFLGVALGVSSQAASTCATTAVEVSSVEPGGPAARAGIKPGDVITAFGGRPVHSYCDLIIDTDNARPGQTVPVTVVRGSRAITVQVTLGEAPRAGG
jgi:serine protease Do